ncbi:hypothetical protein [Micromonospora sp. NPDC050200]
MIPSTDASAKPPAEKEVNLLSVVGAGYHQHQQEQQRRPRTPPPA